MTVRLRFSILLSLAIAVLTLSAFGQTATGTVSGIVADSNGAVILGTKVVLENRETRLRRQAMSKEISCLRLFPGDR